MNRIILSLGAAALIAGVAMGVPAKRGVTTQLTTPDGVTIEAELAGDEFAHYYIDKANRCYTLDSEGLAIVTDINVIRERAATRMAMRRNTPGSKQSPSMRLGTQDKFSDWCVGSLGDIRIPVILVDYTDRAFVHGDGANSTFTNFFQTGDDSGHKYFTDISNGRFRPQFDVYGPYHLSNSRAYYGANDRYGNDQRLGGMVAEGCQLGKDDIDFSLYDNDGDGYCDVVIFIYAGQGEAQSGIANSIWPCQWDLKSSDYGKTLKIGNTTINSFAVFNELNGNSSTKIDGIGTFAHEFSHCLGLPDYYNTDYYSNHYGMGSWSLMDYGCYNNNGYTPLGYSAYDKMCMGWIDDIPEPIPGTKLSLTPMNQGSTDTDIAYRLSGKNPNEYYIIENRTRSGWDKYMPSQGLLIYHVNYDRQRWDSNWVNSENPLCMAVVCADNSRSDYDEYGDLYPYRTNNSFTDTSLPAATLYSGGKLGKPLTNIYRNSTSGIVTCDFMEGETITLPTPDLTGANAPSHESMKVTDDGFTAHWPAVTSIVDLTYSLEIRPHSEPVTQLILEADFAQSNSWETEGYAEIETGGGLRLGSNKQKGTLFSPVFSLDEDNSISVSITCHPYVNDTDVELQITVMDQYNTQLSVRDFTLDSAQDSYNLTFSGFGSGQYRISIAATQLRKRAIIDSIRIYSGDISAVAQPKSETTAPMLLEGLTDNSYTFTGLVYGQTYDWRVKCVPVNSAEANESPWSSFQTVTIDGSAGIFMPEINANPSAVAEYYDLTGRRILSPGHGIYIVRRGNTVTKETLR